MGQDFLYIRYTHSFKDNRGVHTGTGMIIHTIVPCTVHTTQNRRPFRTQYTVCPRRLDPTYKVTCNIKWGKTSGTEVSDEKKNPSFHPLFYGRKCIS